MGFRERYKSYMFSVDDRSVAPYGKDGLSVKGVVSYTLAGTWDATSMSDYVGQWDQKSYKIGLRIQRGQTVRVAYRAHDDSEIVLRKDLRVTAELEDFFGRKTGEEWIGLVPGSRVPRGHHFEAPNIVHFDLTLRITPATADSQMIPFVGRHLEGTFADGSMKGLWVLPARPSKRGKTSRRGKR
jgi:hypothetical protein